jgi:hypothetical protein
MVQFDDPTALPSGGCGPMTVDPVVSTIERYLRAEIDVEEAAASIMASDDGRPGFTYDLSGLDEEQCERMYALMSRLMWLVLRAHDPASAPEQPLSGDHWRAMRKEVERRAGGPDSGDT